MKKLREAMKGMSLKEKIDHLWTYYKIWLLVPVFAGVLINVIYSAYSASRENILVNAVVVSAGNSDMTEFEQELKEYMNKTGKYDKVVIQTNFAVDEQSADTMLAITTLIGAAAIDVFICPEEVYEHFSQQDAFTDITEIVDVSLSCTISERGDAVIVSGSKLLQQELGAVYQDAYISVLDHGKHSEGKKAFVQYVLENQ